MHPLLKRSLLFVGAIIVVVALLTWGIGLDTIKARQVDLIYLGQQHQCSLPCWWAFQAVFC